MKKTLLSPVLLALTSLPALAQLPVSQSAQNRKVVLEEFTGIHCVYCPDGHKRANDLKAAKPAGSVILVNVHTGGFATPAASEPDFRTSEGNSIAAISGMNITGYPTGAINRHLFAGEGGFAVNRGAWSVYADSVLAQPSYVNVALEGTLDVTTRQLTVNVGAYYTGTTTSTNRLTVMLLEDNVSGPQTGAANFYPSQINSIDNSYTHNHMLRKVLTSTFNGEALTTTTSGTSVSKSYTYTIPAQFVNNPSYLGNLQVVAFIAEGNSEIMTAAYGPITLTGFPGTKDAQIMSNVLVDKEVCAGNLTPLIRVYNNGSDAITSATIKASVNGGTQATATFSGSIAPATSALVQIPTVSFTPNPSNTLNLEIATVNGSADPVATGNTVAVSNIANTTRVANDQYLKMNFTQDQYGTESTWKIVEEGTGTVILSGGPYANLSGAGTLLHTDSVKIKNGTCYEILVLDSYGDGINSGAGAGKYAVLSGNTVVYSSNGTFTTKDRALLKSSATASVGSTPAFASSVTLAPNPAATQSVLTLSLEKGTKLSVQVVDVTGRMVNQIAEQNLSAGTHRFPIATDNLAAGVYNVRIATAEGVVTQRLSVVK